MQRDGRRFTVEVASDREGLVSHAGAALVAETADRLGLTKELSPGLAVMRRRRGGHDPGRVVRDLAVMLADGGDCLANLRAVRDQEPPFGVVASDATAFRVIDAIAGDPALLDRLRAARARAREHAWKVGAAPGRIVIDVDATLISSHSEKDGAAGTFRGGFDFHPLLAYLDDSREALAGVLRPGNAPAPTPPPDQRRAAPRDRHPRALPPADPRLRRPPTQPGQEHARSDPLPEALPRPPRLAPAPSAQLRDRTTTPINFLT